MLNTVVTRLVDHDLLHGFKRVKVKLLRYQAKLAFSVNRIFFKIVSEDTHPPGGFIHQRADYSNGGGFSCAIRSQKRIKITRFDLQIYPA